MREKLKTTKPYEGGLGQQTSEIEFTSKEAGKATFKIKQEPQAQKPPEEPDTKKPHSGMLTNEEIK